jgi:hypothetical protein
MSHEANFPQLYSGKFQKIVQQWEVDEAKRNKEQERDTIISSFHMGGGQKR